jgi:hypothetical protein
MTPISIKDVKDEIECLEKPYAVFKRNEEKE